MKTTILGLALATLFAAPMSHAAGPLRLSASHDLAVARPSETMTLAWADVNRALPGALIQHLVVRDKNGRALPYQVTNVAPLAKDPQGVGAAYGELIFQYSFAPGETSAAFTVDKTDELTPVFAPAVHARYVQERLDDFAWENDLVAHRTYGTALGAPAAPGSGKEVLNSSGLDVWFKRVSYPIVDRWYNKGHDHYHKDEGEGMDMYSVGQSRGCGGSGIWDGKQLYTSANYASWKVLANGPVRAVFELTYDSWNAAGMQVSEVKRFTVDAGHQFDQVDSTFTYPGAAPLTVAIGLAKAPTDKKLPAPVIAVTREAASGSIVQWVDKTPHGAFGTAIVLPGASGTAEDSLNHLVLASVSAGKPLRYYVGAAWDRAGRVPSEKDWKAQAAAVAARAASPVRIAITAPAGDSK
jgi:hypothetical protein